MVNVGGAVVWCMGNMGGVSEQDFPSREATEATPSDVLPTCVGGAMGDGEQQDVFSEESTHTNNQDPVPAAEAVVPGLESGVEEDQGSQAETRRVEADSNDEETRKPTASGDAVAEGSSADVAGARGVATPFYLSRTFWVNAVALFSLLVPDVREWLESNPVEFTTALGAVNVLLRFVTYGKHCLVSVLPTEEPTTTETARGACRKREGSSIGSGTALGLLFVCVGVVCWGCAGGGESGGLSVKGGGDKKTALVIDRTAGVLSWSQTSTVTEGEPVVVEVKK